MRAASTILFTGNSGLPGTQHDPCKYEGGESWIDVRNRMPAFLNEIFNKHSGDDVLLVAHGGVMRAIISLLTDRPFEELGDADTPNGGVIRLKMMKIL